MQNKHLWVPGLIGLALIGIAIAWLAPRPAPVEARTPHNVLLIVVDTLRADHLGAWGYTRDTSPHLDALAARSVRFANGTSQAPWTTPSIASLMTSRHPRALGIRRHNSVLPDEATTLAEHLQRAGFTTGAVVSHSFCGSDWGFSQGFESFDESNVLGHLGVSSQGVTEGALSFLEQHKDERFFLWLHYFDPHYVYKLHEGHDFDPDSDYDGRVEDGMYISDLEALTGTLDAPDRAQLDRLYDSEIALTDAQIGRVLDQLEALGLADDTIVVFTADHGEAFDEHGLIGHSKNLYQELIHVPILVRCPGWAPGVVQAPVGNIDLFPTILSCLDLPAPEGGLSGTVLDPEALDAAPPRPVFSHTSKRGERVSVRSGDHKLIARMRKSGDPKLELYDLASDPHETRDLAPRGGPLLEQLSDVLLDWERSTRQGAMDPETIDVDAWLEENLEALGYTEKD